MCNYKLYLFPPPSPGMSILTTYIWRGKIESEKNEIEPDLKFIVLIKSVYIFVIPEEVRVHGIWH